MIVSFRGKVAQLIWEGRYSPRLPPGIQATAINGASVFAGQTLGRKMSKSSTTTRKESKSGSIPNPHPGQILSEDFLEPLGLSQNALARAIGVPPRRINEIVLGKRAVTADTDLRLARYFSVSEGMFLGLQLQYDLMEERRRLGARLDAIRPRAA